MNLTSQIQECRACRSNELNEIFVIENVVLTGVFPKISDQYLNVNDMTLLACGGECGLVQLKQIPSPENMYGDNYGYRSGLNVSMIDHLKFRVNEAESIVNLDKNDCILDIGSNDATLLNHYSYKGINKIGFDPSAGKFKQYYKDDTTLIVDFFSANELKKITDQKLKIITSISMFYDLPDPLEFVKNISEVLHPEGIWITEQSYLFAMLDTNSFDTICQEHLEYYSITAIKWILDKADLKIINVEFNDINGGSVCITTAHKSNIKLKEYGQLSSLLEKEKEKR